MNWTVNPACDVEAVEIDGTSAFYEVRLRGAALPRIAIGLCLLWHELASRLDLLGERGACALQLVKSKEPGSYPATVQWKGKCPTICWSPVEFEARLYFFLRTVRDGVAEVDHFDLDAKSKDDEKSGR